MADQSSFLKPLLLDLTYGASVWKRPVKAVALDPVELTGTQTIDTVDLDPEDEVLLTDQSLPSQNGLWVVATGPWTRRFDGDSNRGSVPDLTAGATVRVTHGTRAGRVYRLETTGYLNIGISAQVWVEDLPPALVEHTHPVATADANGFLSFGDAIVLANLQDGTVPRRNAMRRPRTVQHQDADDVLGVDTINTIVRTTATGMTLTLPLASDNPGAYVLVYNDGASAGNVAVTSSGDETINGGGALSLVPGTQAYLMATEVDEEPMWIRVDTAPAQMRLGQESLLDNEASNLLVDAVNLCLTTGATTYVKTMPDAVTNIGRKVVVIAEGPGTIRATAAGADLMANASGVGSAFIDVAPNGHGEFLAYESGSGAGAWRRMI